MVVTLSTLRCRSLLHLARLINVGEGVGVLEERAVADPAPSTRLGEGQDTYTHAQAVDRVGPAAAC